MQQFNPKEVIKFLQSNGRTIDHIKGSHHVMYHEETNKRTVVAVHKKDISVGTLLCILRQTGYTKEDLLERKNKK